MRAVAADINRRLDATAPPALEEDTKQLYAQMPRQALLTLRAAFTLDRDAPGRLPSTVAFAQARIEYLTQLLGERPEGR